MRPKLSNKRRHVKVLRDNICGISSASIKRLARRGGVVRISSLVYREAKHTMYYFLKNTIRESIIYMEYSKRKTISVYDIKNAIRKNGRCLYGFSNV